MKERTLVWISGNESEVFTLLRLQPELLPEKPAADIHCQSLWVGGSTSAPEFIQTFDHTSPSLARSLIGTERNLIVYNAFDRFDVDSFAAICGMLVHTGTLFLLTPDKNRWPIADQLEMQRFSVYGASQSNPQSLYIHWLVNRLIAHTHETTLQRGKSQGVSVRKLNTRQLADSAVLETMSNLLTGPDIEGNETTPTLHAYSGPNSEQKNILQAWCKPPAIAENGQAQLRILTADRGRGKSALLGMLCAEFLSLNQHCVVTGPNRRSSEILMRHCQEHLGRQQLLQSMPGFLPPDELLANPVNADVLLVDEAAALPLPVLKKLVQNYQQVILATTIHGYEGAGRGFSIRFRDWLQNNDRDFSWNTLESPVRWLAGDRLEMFCNDAFMLNAEYDRSAQPKVSASECPVRFYPADKLLAEYSALRECFALLIQAHYQTKPMDLRHMLDGQNMRVFVLQHNSVILGTALVAMETLDDCCNAELKRAIVEKRRRPRGHLLPQLLAQWTQDEAALNLRIARIVRIAIHPDHQNRGLGSHFLRSLERQLAESTSLDAIGAMFGEDARIGRYWQQNGYHNIHRGRRKNNRSGSRSLTVIKSIEQPLSIIDRARQLYSINFSAKPARHNTETDALSRAARKELDAEITAAYLRLNRSFDDSRQFIVEAIKDRLSDVNQKPANLTKTENRLLALATTSDFDFTDCANELGFAGKKSAEIAFKTALEKLII